MLREYSFSLHCFDVWISDGEVRLKIFISLMVSFWTRATATGGKKKAPASGTLIFHYNFVLIQVEQRMDL